MKKKSVKIEISSSMFQTVLNKKIRKQVDILQTNKTKKH